MPPLSAFGSGFALGFPRRRGKPLRSAVTEFAARCRMPDAQSLFRLLLSCAESRRRSVDGGTTRNGDLPSHQRCPTRPGRAMAGWVSPAAADEAVAWLPG